MVVFSKIVVYIHFITSVYKTNRPTTRQFCLTGQINTNIYVSVLILLFDLICILIITISLPTSSLYHTIIYHNHSLLYLYVLYTNYNTKLHTHPYHSIRFIIIERTEMFITLFYVIRCLGWNTYLHMHFTIKMSHIIKFCIRSFWNFDATLIINNNFFLMRIT